MLNLDHIVSSFSLNQAIVLHEGLCSDHPLIYVYIECINAIKTSNFKKWFNIQDWSCINHQLFMLECDLLLNKVKVPFHLLNPNYSSYLSEFQN